MTHERASGTRLAEAREQLQESIAPHERTERRSLPRADGLVLAASIDAQMNVPHYARAAMDGFAVRADDIADASTEVPATLEVTSEALSDGEASRVHTGSELPDGADTVARIEKVTREGDRIHVREPLPEGKDVAPIGEDVIAGQRLYDPGHRLRPSDLGLLKAAGVREVAVYERPDVAVLPTGEELVEAEPDSGETIETNSLTVASYIERWGGVSKRLEPIMDDEAILRQALRDALDADLVVTIGGSSVGERDIVPGVIESMGDLLVHHVGIKPGHPVGIGNIGGTPVLLLPGYPVSCIINAVQFLRPAISWLVATDPKPLPTRTAELDSPIETGEGIRKFVRVRFASEASETGEVPVVEPMKQGGAGVLSSVALADGWIEIPEETIKLSAGARVTVQDWEWHP